MSITVCSDLSFETYLMRRQIIVLMRKLRKFFSEIPLYGSVFNHYGTPGVKLLLINFVYLSSFTKTIKNDGFFLTFYLFMCLTAFKPTWV